MRRWLTLSDPCGEPDCIASRKDRFVRIDYVIGKNHPHSGEAVKKELGNSQDRSFCLSISFLFFSFFKRNIIPDMVDERYVEDLQEMREDS
jgi:hypothetical protein